MLDLLQDLRHAVRTFRTQPVFTATVLITLALGIGASTAMFSVLNAVLLKPLPQANAARVVRLYQPNEVAQTTGLSPLEIADFRVQAERVVGDIVEYHSMPFTFIGEREPQRLQTGVVSASFFEAMGIRAVVGRTFLPGEDVVGADPVLVLSHEYWQREFGGDPDVVGRTLQMNDRTHTVVGVLPPFPQYPGENDVYMPSSSCPFRSGPGWAENRAARGLSVFAVLNAGVSAADAMPELRAVSARLQQEYPQAYPAGVRFDVSAVPLAELIARPAQTTVILLLLATVLLLGIVCANVGNLMIVRLLRRDGEMAVRLAFGATRGRLLRQLLAESAVLAAAGGALGLIVAFAATGGLATFVARFSPRASEIGVDGPVLGFAIGASAVTALIAGLLPLTALRKGIATTLREGSGRSSATSAQARVRSALIVLEVAVSLVLLVGAGLLMRTMLHVQSIETGVQSASVMTARLDLNWTRYATQQDIRAFHRALEQSLGEVTGFETSALGSSFPLNGDPANNVRFAVEGRTDDGDSAPAVAAMTASTGYFAALGVPIVRGRAFAIADENPEGELVVVITRALGERYWPDADPVGNRISVNGGQTWARIVGVSGDLRLDMEGEFDNLVFLPHARFGGLLSRVLVRSTMPPAAVERVLRASVAAIDPQQPITEIRPLDVYRGELLSPYRLTAMLMGIFALIALGVTAVGLGGTIAFSIAQRTREIGIRVAIGARPPEILRMVFGHVAALTVAGIGIGVVLALWGTRFLEGLVLGVERADALTYSIVVSMVLLVTAFAGFLPAMRAVRVDPLVALRGG